MIEEVAGAFVPASFSVVEVHVLFFNNASFEESAAFLALVLVRHERVVVFSADALETAFFASVNKERH